MKKTKEQASWIVKLKCTVIKEVICEGCSEEEARANPYGHSVQETELDTPDFEVTAVEPND